MNEREIYILEKFYYKSELNILDLSKEFNVSERMIRYNIQNINNILKLIKIPPIKKVSKGKYLLNIKRKSENLLEIIKELEPLDKDKRIYLMKILLLFSNEKITIKYLTDFLEVSRVTIKKNLKIIEKELELMDLTLKQQNGIKIIGNNESIYEYTQLQFSYNIFLLFEKSNNDFKKKFKNIIFNLINQKTIIKLKKFIDELIEDFKIKPTDLEYKIFFTKILLIFIKKNNFIILNQNNLINKKNIELEKYILNKFKSLKLKNLLSEEKTKEIYNLVYWIKSYDFFEFPKNDWININFLSKNIINHVEKKLKINISKDVLLYKFLTQHLKSLIYKIKMGYKTENEILDINNKIKDKLYFCIKESLNILNNYLGSEINDDEIHILRFHFLASIDRTNNQAIKADEIIIISTLGPGSNQILVDNIKNNFNIKVVYIGPEFKLKSILKENPNVKYILSTSNLKKEYLKNKEIIKISTILNKTNIENLKLKGLKINTNKILLSNLLSIINKHCIVKDEENLKNSLLQNFNNKIANDIIERIDFDDFLIERNIIFDAEFNSLEIAIQKSCKLLENTYIKSSYTKEVLNIFKKNSSVIMRANGVILPHTKNENNVLKSGISIINLKKPLKIKDTKEKIKTIVTFAIEDEKNLGVISNIINKVFTEEFKIKIKEKNKTSLIEYLKSNE